MSLPVIAVAERVRAGAGRRVTGAAIAAISAVCGIRYRVVGLDRLTPGRRYVLVPNHSSPVDIPALLRAAPDVRFVAAAELFRVPLLGAVVRALESVPVDRSRPRQAREQLATAAAGAHSLVVFAEGGIPPAGEVRRFQTGPFVLAVEAGADVVPVTITGSATVLPRRHKVFARPGLITVELHEPIATAGMTVRDRKALRDRTEAVVRGVD